MPLWMQLDAAGIAIVDVRDERSAVHMAHAYGMLRNTVGVALVTAGPGVTNAITGIANAHVARASVLVLSGVPPRAQEGRGALQDIVHTDLVRSITRSARTVREPSLALQALDEAFALALGDGGEPGPAYLDFPTDTLRADFPNQLALDEAFSSPRRARPLPDPQRIAEAADLLASSRRPLVISGRGSRNAGASLVRLLDTLGAAYLDTGESRGLVPETHRSVVAAMRGSVLGEADVVVTVGRRLDFQLAYGSPAIFGDAAFIRIADIPGELHDNRRGVVEILADCGEAMDALVSALSERRSHVDRAWVDGVRDQHVERVLRHWEAMRAAPADAQGRMHPNVLLACLQEHIGPPTIVVADGGDFLSFARTALTASTWLDPG